MAAAYEAEGKRIAVGFDGFVDTIARPVMQAATQEKQATYWPGIPALGQYLVGQGGKSCSIELDVVERRIGGNAPLLAVAAHELGLETTLVGMLGEGNVDEIFWKLPFDTFTYMASGTSTALEFGDGKVMLAPGSKLEGDAWQTFAEKAGEGALTALAEADVLALVNWSELSFSQALWEGTWQHLLMGQKADKQKVAFFDLADMTRKSKEETLAVLGLMGEYSARRTTVLSLNENEALLCGKRALGDEKDLVRVAQGLRTQFGIDEVIVHTVRQSILCSPRGSTAVEVEPVQSPVRSTGAGDNFNAACCLGAVSGLGDEERLALANASVRHFLLHGQSAGLQDLNEPEDEA